MHGKLSLQGRLTACFLAFSVLPLLLFFLVFFPYLRSSIVRSRMASLEALASANAGDLEQMGDTILREGERLAMDQRVLSLLGALSEEGAADQAQSYLSSMVNENCLGAVLVKPDWEVRAASSPAIYTHDALALLLDSGASLGSDREVSGLLPSLADPGRSSIYFTVPVQYGDQLLGALVREMPLSVLDRKTGTPNQGETGQMMLVDQSGIILSHTDLTQVGKPLSDPQLLSAFSGFYSGVRERSGNGSAVINGAEQGYGYHILNTMPWMLVVYQAQSEMRSQEVLIILFTVLATLGLSLLSFLIGRIVSRSLVFPLRRLNAAFRQAGYNQFTYLPPAGPRETVELAQGYNAMIGLVEKNITSLSDSNRQLATTIAELEIEQDRLQFYRETPGEAGARRAVAEFNLLSGEVLADDAFYAMLQLSPSLPKFSLSDFLNDMAEPEDAAAVQEQLIAQADQVHQLVRVRTAQGLRFIKVHARVYYNMQAEPTKVSATLLDVTSAYTPAPEDDLQDSTTGLATKTPFLQALNDALSAEDAIREGGLVACLTLQNLPKEEGQRTARILALRISADRLRAFAAPEGMAARLDGDKFLLHLPHFGQPDLAEACLAELEQALSAPIPWQKTVLTLKMLAGAAIYPQPKGATAELLVSQAQTAMSAAAVSGSVSWMLFDPARQAEDADTARLALESVLRGRKITEALSTFQEDDSLSLEYQPILQLWTGGVEGFECTVRLRVPELGMVSAGELIPLAESSGMMLKVGRYILKEACRRIRILRLRQKQELYISVNLSAQQLDDPVFTDMVYLTLKETSLPGSALQLEISERVMDTIAAQADKLRALRQLGVRIALDDYGAGTGSLAHLYNMPLDVLKVSRNFLTGASFSMGKEFILKTMVDLAHNLNLKVAAVGVEHTSRLNTLMKLGYDMAQGYHFCPPLDPAALEVFLDTRAQEGMH